MHYTAFFSWGVPNKLAHVLSWSNRSSRSYIRALTWRNLNLVSCIVTWSLWLWTKGASHQESLMHICHDIFFHLVILSISQFFLWIMSSVIPDGAAPPRPAVTPGCPARCVTWPPGSPVHPSLSPRIWAQFLCRLPDCLMHNSVILFQHSTCTFFPPGVHPERPWFLPALWNC